LLFESVSWLPFKMDTVCVSESLKMPATAVGSCGAVAVMGVPGTVLGVEAPAIVTGAAFSMVERYEASEPCSVVI
jgi:hypothetical protein